MRSVVRVARYRFGATVARRWGSYVAVVVLIGVTGGIALGALAAARRTQSAYPRFLASSNPSDLTVSSFAGSNGAAIEDLSAKIRALPGVRHVASVELPMVAPLTATGAPNFAARATVFPIASSDGEVYRQDRVGVVHGRMANLARADEAVLTASAASQLHVGVGDTLRLGVFTPNSDKPKLAIAVKLTGIVVFDNAVIQDDIDRAYGFVLLTPALQREAVAVAPSNALPILYALQLDGGAAAVTTVEHEFIRIVPPQAQYEFHATAPVIAQDEDAIRPESIAIAAFGFVALLVALVIAGQALSRLLRLDDADRHIMRDVGATPAMTTTDGLLGALGAIVAGSLIAVFVAVLLSPLAPFGPVRTVYPARGLSFDTTVLVGGFFALVVLLSGLTVAIAYRRAPHRMAQRGARDRVRRSRAASAAASAGLPVPVVTGTRFALEPGSGRTAVPVRSTLTSTALAITIVVAALTFASGLQTLVSHPALYGWNWSYDINPSASVPALTQSMLTRDPDVKAWSGANDLIVEIDGQTVPGLLQQPGAAVSPPILSGHGLAADNEIVLGGATLGRLHKHVGDTVVVSYGTPTDAPAYIAPRSLRIVGSATLPAVGFASIVADHTSMGTGALMSLGVESPAFRKAQLHSDTLLNGYDQVFVVLRSGVSRAQGRAELQQIVDRTDRAYAADSNAAGNNVALVDVQRPAQIVNYRTIGGAPVGLAAGLAVGAIGALALTLTASVRRRRRDLALLKALGLTRRQLASVVAAQATVAAALGVVVGIPLGIFTGRALWELFARAIDAVPEPTVPVVTVILVGIGALVLANLVAAIPGRSAARTRTAVLLHAE